MSEVNNKEYILKEESVKKALTIMVIPSVIAGAINQLNVIIDTYFLGNFAASPTDAQTATSTSMTVVMLMNALSIMVAIGTAVSCSQLLGKNMRDKVQRYMANSFVYGWILYTVLLLILLPTLPWFVGLLTGGSAGDLVYDNSIWYTRILLIGFPTIIFVQLSSQTIRAEGQSALIVKMAAIQVVINIIINFLLISDTIPAISFYGTNFEAAGAAIATIISQFVMAIVLMAVLFNKEKTNYYINLKNFKFCKEWLEVFKNGAPQFVANIFFAIGTFLIAFSITLVAKRLDYDLVQSVQLQAASGINVRIGMMMFLLINGGIQGIQGFVAYQYGSNAKERLRESLLIIKRTAFIVGIVLFLVFFFGASYIAQIFSTDEVVVKLVTLANRAFAVTTLFFPMAHSMFGLFASVGRPKLAVICTVIRDGILLSGFAILLPLLFDEIGVMLIMSSSLLIGSVFIIFAGQNVLKKIYREE